MERNKNIDILKAVCAFLVVCIHINFPGEFGESLKIVGTVAVPIFFIITGYFYNKTVEKHKETSQIKKILILLISTILIYYLYNILVTILSGNSVSDYLVSVINIKSIIKFLFFNDVTGIGHAWYLSAILYTLIVFKLFNLNKHKKLMNYFLIIAFIFQIVGGKYSNLIFGFDMPYYIRRNFLFIAIPYFYLGILINNNECKIKISNTKLVIIAIFLLILTFCEKYVLDLLGKNTISSYYLGIIMLPIPIFLLTIKSKQARFSKLLVTVGRKYSTTIYIIHPLVIGLLDEIIISLHLEWVAPIIVYFISTLIAVLIEMIRKKGRKLYECGLFNR